MLNLSWVTCATSKIWGGGRGREVCANIVIWRSDIFMGNFQHFGKDNILSQTLFVKTKSPKKKVY